ncbi:MAG: RecB family exonuclease [Patescibacteria group bacterium]
MRKTILPWKVWSATKLELLLFRCPLSFCFNYVLKIKAPEGIEKVFGGAIHRMVEKFFTLKKGYKSEKSFTEAWKHYWWKEILGKRPKEMIRVRNSADPEKFLATGINILRRFYWENIIYRKEGGLFLKPVVEERFSWILKGHRITGVKDRIQPFPNGEIEIWDYKTGLRKFTEEELRRDIQFTFYNLDHFKKFGRNPDRMLINYLFSGEQINVPLRPKKDYEQLGRWLDEATIYVENILQPIFSTWKGFLFRWLNPEDIERKYFSPRPGSFCRICDYEQICREYYPKEPIREKWIKQELDKIGPDLGHVQLDLPMPPPKVKRKRKPSW